MRRAVLVGEQNPYGGDPEFALYPAPDGCSGERLCRLVLGTTRRRYLDLFERRNLCSGPWKMAEAVAEAVRIRSTFIGCAVVLLGAKVSRAFRLDFEPFTVVRPSPVSRGCFIILPHPSGLNLMWNAPGAFERARQLVAQEYPFDML